MMKTLSQRRFLIDCLALAALVLATQPASAADAAKVSAAKEFVTQTDRAKGILFFCHPTATFRSTEVTAEGGVTINGQPKPGAFYLTVRMSWRSLFDETNTSDLNFFFDATGKLTDIQAGKTTSIFAQFSAADLVIGAIRDQLFDEIAKWNSPAARQAATALINKADARGLLTIILQQTQP